MSCFGSERRKSQKKTTRKPLPEHPRSQVVFHNDDYEPQPFQSNNFALANFRPPQNQT